MNRIFLLFVCLAISVVSFGQGGTASNTVPPEISTGRSMKETEAWINREIPVLGSYSKVLGKNDDRSFLVTFKYQVENAVLENCRLSLRWTMDVTYANRQTLTNVVTLKDVDVNKIRALEEPVVPGYTQNRPSYLVSLTATTDSGSPFTTQIKQEGKPIGDTKPMAVAFVRVGGKDAANRAMEVFRQAAVLCGAPNVNGGTATADVTKGTGAEISKPASKITNYDVIQLVKEGLSEQVIITSIRQAPVKDFDLAPTGLIALKKAGVSDALIVVMQEKPVPATTSDEPRTPPKYDPTLADPPKPAATPVRQDSCSGIENMGLYKNDVMSAAIGGGLVEWLAKIRNNTSITKIVVFGWIDMYGQQKKAQIQIRGGDIATPRLDLTQARVIPPVRDLKIMSCQ